MKINKKRNKKVQKVVTIIKAKGQPDQVTVQKQDRQPETDEELEAKANVMKETKAQVKREASRQSFLSRRFPRISSKIPRLE